MTDLRRPALHPASPQFQPMPLVAMFLNLFGRRARKTPLPQNLDWEREEPMSGLS
ncbi:MAG: hypothetical protein H6R19_961 [Proteobacteria bacterium]|jgi:hypothetical protein|nr:hypothetical protein [Pseudomonadota bacterium]